MRGDHLILGRNDYTAPLPLTAEQLTRVKACEVKPRSTDRIKPFHKHAVILDGVEIGMVATRMAGQYAWPPGAADNEGWILQTDWRPDEPPHARAVLCLLDNSRAATTHKRPEGCSHERRNDVHWK